MNIKLLTLFTCLFSLSAYAQQADSLTMGAGSPSYPYDVYYNLTTHEKDTFSNTNWHLAFGMRHAMGVPGVTIRINEGRNVAVYNTPYKVADWSTVVDTAGLSTWTQLHNDMHTWDVGALNANRDTSDIFDMGWGEYDMASHDIVGTRLFIVALGSGSSKTFRKLIINRLAYDSLYSWTSSKLDGSDSMTSYTSKNAFINKMFGYYSFTTNTTINREPNHPWDLLFTYYRDTATFPPYPVAYYPFMGVLQAPQVSVARVRNVPKTESDTLDATFYSKNISSIGWDWKKVYLGPPPSGPYDLTDSLSYFIKRDHDSSEVFKLYFTLFTNVPANNIVFNTEVILTHVGIVPVSKTADVAIVYPNPANEWINVSLTRTNGAATIRLTDLAGKVAYELNTTTTAAIPVSSLNKGIYLISIQHAEGTEVHKVIIQ